MVGGLRQQHPVHEVSSFAEAYDLDVPRTRIAVEQFLEDFEISLGVIFLPDRGDDHGSGMVALRIFRQPEPVHKGFGGLGVQRSVGIDEELGCKIVGTPLERRLETGGKRIDYIVRQRGKLVCRPTAVGIGDMLSEGRNTRAAQQKGGGNKESSYHHIHINDYFIWSSL